MAADCEVQWFSNAFDRSVEEMKSEVDCIFPRPDDFDRRIIAVLILTQDPRQYDNDFDYYEPILEQYHAEAKVIHQCSSNFVENGTQSNDEDEEIDRALRQLNQAKEKAGRTLSNGKFDSIPFIDGNDQVEEQLLNVIVEVHKNADDKLHNGLEEEEADEKHDGRMGEKQRWWRK